MLYRSVIKPFFDFIVALGMFFILFPIFIVVALFLMFHLKGSPFFLQSRPGKNEHIFKIIKFRTMNNAKDLDGNLLPDAQRLKSVGKFVRSASLDEIPQLLNVLKGDMSIVGPRPLLPEYLPLYNEFQKKRHKVKPGITGWAQVNGRNFISWKQKFELDVFYVQNISFVLDLKILLKTFVKVFMRKDINAEGHATAEKFKGESL